ncbi:hypothetical protein BRADI_4g22587v3 [Brachypodium distachyon]|uniref:Uncharacterized protein n=1 Tax=Brachypodium distachyon TaxID=15368 RepID=A0A2K2CPK7_BRADI|nr:hypothetical protein BRADI_4g22587v3 [Brachypodium distachyon]
MNHGTRQINQQNAIENQIISRKQKKKTKPLLCLASNGGWIASIRFLYKLTYPWYPGCTPWPRSIAAPWGWGQAGAAGRIWPRPRRAEAYMVDAGGPSLGTRGGGLGRRPVRAGTGAPGSAREEKRRAWRRSGLREDERRRVGF